MSDYFQAIPKIKFEGKESNNPLAFKYYNPQQKVLGKTIEDHLRMAVCYWHTFNWPGGDPFGGQTFYVLGWNQEILLSKQKIN